MFNLNHFYYFYITAKVGGVTKAAEILNIAQPSLSSQLKNFELSIDKKLFKKVGRKLELTHEGLFIYEYAKKTFQNVFECQSYLKEGNFQEKIQLKIGVSDEVERPFVAHLLSKILKSSARKKISIAMPTDDHRSLVQCLEKGIIDALITNAPLYQEGFVTLASLTIPVVCVAAPSFFQSRGMKNLSLRKILSLPNMELVLPSEELKLRTETDLFLQKYKIKEATVFESNILSAVTRAAVEGLGIAFLPEIYVEKELAQKELVQIDKNSDAWSHRLFLIALDRPDYHPMIKDIESVFKKYK